MPADAAPSFLLLPELPEPGREAALPDGERHYVRRVCRLRAGERVRATDGRGRVAVLRAEGAPAALALVGESLEALPPPAPAVLLCGAPEGERGDWLVEKLAELGVTRLEPVDCARGSWDRAPARLARWERLAAAGLRQSLRAWRMEIAAARPLPEALRALAGGAGLWLADPGGAAPVVAPAGAVAGLVGPSGGLAPDEKEAASAAGFRAIRLSSARLRTETAALALASWWSPGR